MVQQTLADAHGRRWQIKTIKRVSLAIGAQSPRIVYSASARRAGIGDRWLPVIEGEHAAADALEYARRRVLLGLVGA